MGRLDHKDFIGVVEPLKNRMNCKNYVTESKRRETPGNEYNKWKGT